MTGHHIFEIITIKLCDVILDCYNFTSNITLITVKYISKLIILTLISIKYLLISYNISEIFI